MNVRVVVVVVFVVAAAVVVVDNSYNVVLICFKSFNCDHRKCGRGGAKKTKNNQG